MITRTYHHHAENIIALDKLIESGIIYIIKGNRRYYMTYELIKKNFDRGLWSEKQLELAKTRGFITEKQYKEIISSKK